MAALFRVKAVYEYSSPHEDDLNFDIGQIITVTDEDEDDWYGGEYVSADGTKHEGIFPRNFVEKIEPTAPPRPTRTRPKKDSESAPAPEPTPASPPPTKPETAPAPLPPREPEPEPEPKIEETPKPAEPEPVPLPVQQKPVEQPVAQPTAPAAPPREPQAASPPVASPKPKGKPGPPPVSEKPSSFKDRIAAFNKPAAPPVAPVKPGGLSAGRGVGNGGGGGFIKKPFVAPPPSRHAFVPPPTAAPTAKVYRREEDPEVKQNEAEAREQAGKAGLIPAESGEAAGEEDQPKPTSLKERIALLQQQQREQAERHANAAAKKPKPAKPAKKPEIAPPTEDAAEGEDTASIERVDSGTRTSIDEPRSPRGPPPPRRKASKGPAVEPVHDGNEADMSGAGDTTEGQDDDRDDNDESSRRLSKVLSGQSAAAIPSPKKQEEDSKPEQEKDNEDEEEEDEDEDVDPEVKRKEELRARMAKMSGGMGFHGMFGAPAMPAPAPPKKKKSVKASEEPAPIEEAAEETVSRAAPPIPTAMMLPGMGGPRKLSEVSHESREEEEEPEPTPRTAPPAIPVRQPEPAAESSAGDDEDEETPAPTPALEDVRRDSLAAAPPIPGSRPAPPPVPTENRPPPPPPPIQDATPTEGSESDDELSGSARDKAPEPIVTAPQSPPMPPPSEPIGLPMRSPPLSPRSEDSPSSPQTMASKRNSRPPPPIPGAVPLASRPPPPPPPGNLSRQSTADITPTPIRPPQAGEENEKEGSEYEGDYDTDIASSVPHKDALKAHARDSSVEDVGLVSPTTDAPPSGPPPVPTAIAPRAAPPPVPPSKASPEASRRSVDVPRVAPPPPPPGKEPIISPDQKVFDPYHYNNATGYAYKKPKIEEEYFGEPQSPPERRVPPLTPSARGRLSSDIPRSSLSGRRSLEVNRGDFGFIANDIDLAVQSGWWKQANQVPPVLQGRKDICFESDESTTTNGGSKTVITREIFVLFQDYSQTIIVARYDPYDPSDVELEQRHEGPPRPLRQDQMESFYERFGRHIGEAAASKKDSIVGDGTPYGFVQELLRPFPDALGSVGTRSYGALVYSNMANASTQLHDVIRTGDILSIRNARFQGKHGPMHAKYSVEVGKPDHVAVVAEWDGTKKKVRAWEQGRESKKVKQESFKLDDLRSGEVKIWRVMPRSWIGWNTTRSS